MDLAQLGERLGQLMDLRQVQSLHGFHEDHALFVCDLIQLLELFGSDDRSLFADDILAVLEQRLSRRIMEGIGVCNIYRIDIAFTECVQIVIDSGDTMLCAKRLTLRIAERINRGMHKIRCILLCAFEEGIDNPTSANCRKFNHVTLLLALWGIYRN